MARRDETPREPRDAAQQRVYVGVVGLAVVFLLTLLAASLLAVFGQDAHGGQTMPANGAATNGAAPNEPLAELGVAPGNQPRPAPGTATPSPPPPIRR